MSIFSHQYYVHSGAFLEHVNATFYMWPIGCSLFAQNITAVVRGDNVLLWKNTTSTSTSFHDSTPFIRSSAPSDPLEMAWGVLMLNAFAQDVTYTLNTTQLFTPFELQLLSGLNNTNNSLALLGERLTTMTSLSYALFVWDFLISTPGRISPDSWSPVFATIFGSHSFVMAGLVIQILPLVIGAVTCFILIFVFVTATRRSQSSDNIIRDGRMISVISLLRNSSLPAIVHDSDEITQDIRRERAIRTHVS
jgi:hypothetical protein